MKPATIVLRAVTSQFLRGKIVWFIKLLLIIYGAILLLTILLVFLVDYWWLLLLAVLMPLIMLVTLITAIVWFANEKLMPRSFSLEDRLLIRSFVNNLEAVIGTVTEPWPVIALKVAFDVLRGKESRKLQVIIGQSKKLSSEFGQLVSIANK